MTTPSRDAAWRRVRSLVEWFDVNLGWLAICFGFLVAVFIWAVTR